MFLISCNSQHRHTCTRCYQFRTKKNHNKKEEHNKIAHVSIEYNIQLFMYILNKSKNMGYIFYNQRKRCYLLLPIDVCSIFLYIINILKLLPFLC